MNIETRVRALEKLLAQGERGETQQERIAKFLELAAQGFSYADIRAIAAEQWDNVTAPVLLASRHRDRWERAAPALLLMLEQDYAQFENAA